MGDYSELYFSNSKVPRSPGGANGSDTPYLVSKYHVPLFWLALFEREDIVDVRDEAMEEIWPHLVKARIAAAATFSSRVALIQRRFPSARPQWQEQFGELLQRTSFEYVHLDTTQIGSMSGTAREWRTDLETILGMFVESPASSPIRTVLGKLFYKWSPSPGWELFQMRLGTAFAGTKGRQAWPYCGESATEKPMPWEA